MGTRSPTGGMPPSRTGALPRCRSARSSATGARGHDVAPGRGGGLAPGLAVRQTEASLGPFLARLLGALCLLATVYHLGKQLPFAAAPEAGVGRDVAVYYQAARDTAAGRSPYRSAG